MHNQTRPSQAFLSSVAIAEPNPPLRPKPSHDQAYACITITPTAQPIALSLATTKPTPNPNRYKAGSLFVSAVVVFELRRR